MLSLLSWTRVTRCSNIQIMSMPYVKSSRTSAIGSAENSQRVVVHLSKCKSIVLSTSPVQSPAFTLTIPHLGVILLNTVKGQSVLQVISLAYTELCARLTWTLGEPTILGLRCHYYDIPIFTIWGQNDIMAGSEHTLCTGCHMNRTMAKGWAQSSR